MLTYIYSVVFIHVNDGVLTIEASSRAALGFGKVLTLCRKLPLNCGYSKQGKFPLRSYRTEKSTCRFRFALDKEARSHDDQLFIRLQRRANA